VNLYPNPAAPLIPLYPNSPVAENRSRQNLTCVMDASTASPRAVSSSHSTSAVARNAATCAASPCKGLPQQRRGYHSSEYAPEEAGECSSRRWWTFWSCTA
jgi:hypothetical protein